MVPVSWLKWMNSLSKKRKRSVTKAWSRNSVRGSCLWNGHPPPSFLFFGILSSPFFFEAKSFSFIYQSFSNGIVRKFNMMTFCEKKNGVMSILPDLFFCNSKHLSFIRLRFFNFFTASFTQRFYNINNIYTCNCKLNLYVFLTEKVFLPGHNRPHNSSEKRWCMCPCTGKSKNSEIAWL